LFEQKTELILKSFYRWIFEEQAALNPYGSALVEISAVKGIMKEFSERVFILE
jgi:hypothetical protein